MKALSFLLLLLLAALPARAQQTTNPAPIAPLSAPAPAPAAPAAPVGPYKIVPGDRLTVTVLEDPNLNSQVLVRPDGRITLPIAGSIPVEGRSPEEVQAIVRDRLAGSFAVVPTVSVALASVALTNALPTALTQETVYVLGEVSRPGQILYTPPQTLNVLQALAQAGGLTRFARGEDIQIRRVAKDTGEETILPFNYEDLEEGRALTTNVVLKDGDVIFVPERGLFD